MDISTAYVHSASGYPRCLVAKIILDIMNMTANPAILGRPSMVGRSTVVCADVEIIQCLGPTDLNKEQLSNKRASRDELSPQYPR